MDTGGFKQGLPPIPENIGSITGPPFLGIILNWFLFGILTLQYYLYYVSFPNDRLFLRLAVTLICAVELVQTMLTVADGFHWFVFGFGNTSALNEFFFANFDSPIMTAIVALVVQCMYAWRVYRISQAKFFTLIITLCALAQATGGIGIGIVHQQAGTISNWPSQYQPLLIIWAGFSALADVLIASIMTWLLLRSQGWEIQEEKRRNMLTKIVRLTIETNVASAAVALAELLTCTIPAIAPPKSSYFLAPYSNSFLAMLNNRTLVRQDFSRSQGPSRMVSFNAGDSRRQWESSYASRQPSVTFKAPVAVQETKEDYSSSQFPFVAMKSSSPRSNSGAAFISLFAAWQEAASPFLSVPLSSSGASGTPSLAFLGRDVPECLNPVATRSVLDILWSCFATIFACTWVAVHPNVPSPHHSGWTTLKSQILVMTVAIFAPECVMMWALRQNLGARKHANNYNLRFNLIPQSRSIFSMIGDWFSDDAKKSEKVELAWGMTHGFLLEMRGMALYHDGKPHKFIEDVSELTQRFDMPAEAVYDKSKGDFLTKLLAILQTSWFAAQCITRWATGLYVTELEVMTLAFACFNVVTYALWWHKPQNMRVALPLQPPSSPFLCPCCGKFLTSDVVKESTSAPPQGQQSHHFLVRLKFFLITLLKIFLYLIRVPTWPIIISKLVVSAILKMTGDSEWSKGFHEGGGTFKFQNYEYYSSEPGNQAKVMIPISIIGTIFGALHLIPLWLSSFPSQAGRIVWMVCAIWVTAQPLLLFPVQYIQKVLVAHDVDHKPMLSQMKWIGPILILVVIQVGSSYAYPLSRLILFAVSLYGLSVSPPDAFRAVDWSSFIPHI
ncbi:hypothetical protein NP233_g11594 [Leucocoprinus birnbaumii]|uniref:DUF6534 domain-containing protein n=1 Tax=Leucocoprinus birnbaumii TaxID=56174 RepID=A0AAD5VH63_9AGAR|nr:hypothetical protein NP233_g11594 [Leucocoprinus birnbaumii]